MTKELLELAALLARRTKAKNHRMIAEDVLALRRCASRATSIAVAQCNYLETDAADKKRDPIRRKVAELLKPYHLKGELRGDPRGFCLRIMSLPGNTWGGDSEGFGL